MKKALAVFLFITAGVAHAENTSNSTALATQNTASTSTAQGTIQFSQTPEHTTETVHNVSGPILGAYAGSFSQMNCGQTAQGGMAFAGFSIAGGASKDSQSCMLEVAAFETARQATVTGDMDTKVKLEHAAVAIRCQVSEEVYKAYTAAGLDCLGLKPSSLHSRTDDQPANYRVASDH
jgi:hypothetical protein